MHIVSEKKQLVGKTKKFNNFKELSCKIALRTAMDFQMMEQKLQYNMLCAEYYANAIQEKWLVWFRKGCWGDCVLPIPYSMYFYLFRYDKNAPLQVVTSSHPQQWCLPGYCRPWNTPSLS